MAHFNLAAELMKQGRYDEAIDQYQDTVRIRPRYLHAQCNLAVALATRGYTKEAITHYYTALKNDPDDRYALNNLAWLRASCPQSAFRNGAEAVELARRAVRLSNGREAAITGTLAAAYAEAGRFPEAVQTARQAIDLAMRQNNQALAKDTEARLQLYMNRKPYRQPAPTSPPGAAPGDPTPDRTTLNEWAALRRFLSSMLLLCPRAVRRAGVASHHSLTAGLVWPILRGRIDELR